MTGKRTYNWICGYQALVYAAGILLATGLVSNWGEWYSNSTPFRNQTDALLNGHLALSDNVHDLRFDHTWSKGGVQQVWGLGVPFWRLPFEAASRLFDWEAFPDRIAFGVFALLVGFVSLKVWIGNADAPLAGGEGGSAWHLIRGFGAGLFILLLFPPFLTLLQTRSAVWEEAVSYEYLFAVLQLALLVAFIRRPSAARLLIVCGLAGFGGLVRPTLIFYGFAAVAVAVARWLLKCLENRAGNRSQACPALGKIVMPALLGLLLFGIGGGVLWLTNLKRFGNGFEFGHRLNVQHLYGSMYATRFDDPFMNEPFAGAAKELFGVIFLAHRQYGGDWYQENIFPGQSQTVRWRDIYFRTFDGSFLPLILIGWAAAIVAAFRVGTLARDGGTGGAIATEKMTAMTAGLWSLIAAVPLFGFYLRCPVISSRYMMDLAPAFAAAIVAAWLVLTSRCQLHRWRMIACVLLCGWIGAELYLSRPAYRAAPSVTWEELKRERDSSESKAPPEVADHDQLGDGGSGIPFDRTGWDQETGALMPLVILFVKDADFLELEVETREHPRIAPNPEDFRAKVGLEFLERRRVTKTENGWIIRFRGPQRRPWSSGLQSAFVATVPNRFLDERTTPWVLKWVRWR